MKVQGGPPLSKKNHNNNYYFFCSPHIGLTFYKENCMDIITTFGVRGKIEPKNGPQRNGFLGGLLEKWLLLSGDSKSLALLGYCYTIEGHHLILHCQNWWTLPLSTCQIKPNPLNVYPKTKKNIFKNDADSDSEWYYCLAKLFFILLKHMRQYLILQEVDHH